MKIITLVVIFTLPISLWLFAQQKHQVVSTKRISLIKVKDLDTIIIDPCSSISIEFTGLYSILDTLPLIQKDTSIVKWLLIRKGMLMKDFSWGNWSKGPRFTELQLTKDNCNCLVYKKYYYNFKHNDGHYDLKITERIICNAENDLDD